MFSKSTAQAFFPILVWVRDLETALATRLNTEYKQHFQEFIAATPDQTTLQSSNDLHQHPEFGELVKAIHATTDDVFKFLEVDSSGFQISGCWANFGAPGAGHIAHNHVNNYLSGIYYVSAPSGGNAITFHDPRVVFEQISPRFKKTNDHNATSHTLAVKSGQLLVFPAWLTHSVAPNESAEIRISISFNIIFSNFSEQVAPPQWNGVPYKKAVAEKP